MDHGFEFLLKSLCGDFAYVRLDDRIDGVRELLTKLEGVRLKLLDTPGERLHDSKRVQEIRTSMKLGSLGI